MDAPNEVADRRGLRLSWIGLCLALALHVADEALNDFLGVYNPQVARIREAVPWLPLPRFGFTEWLAGLSALVLLLLALTPFVVRGGRLARAFAAAVALLMTANGAAHVVGSAWQRWWMPGASTAPLLIIAAGFVLSFLLGPARDDPRPRAPAAL